MDCTMYIYWIYHHWEKITPIIIAKSVFAKKVNFPTTLYQRMGLCASHYPGDGFLLVYIFEISVIDHKNFIQHSH